MTGKEDTYRAPAIRALTAITDVSHEEEISLLYNKLNNFCLEHIIASH
jgi:hypothetical protein